MILEIDRLPDKNRALRPTIASITQHLLLEMEKDVPWHRPSRFTPVSGYIFGSVLDPIRFDREGSGLSDLDFLMVVAQDFQSDDVNFFGDSLTHNNVPNIVHLKHFARPHTRSWDQGRDVDLIFVSKTWIRWIVEHSLQKNDEQLAGLANGSDALHTALASGLPLFENFDELTLACLNRLRSLYRGYT